VTTTVRDFVKMAFEYVGVELTFEGEGVNEVARVAACNHPDFQLPLGKEVVKVDPHYFRPTEVDLLIGDPSKAKQELGWEATYDLPALVNDMMQSDLALMKRQQAS